MARSMNTPKNRLSAERKAILQERVKAALAKKPLIQLRHARKLTQQQIAQSLKIKQASVSKMEHQTDMHISTIRKYIKALGGELEMVAKFPEGSIKVESFDSV